MAVTSTERGPTDGFISHTLTPPPLCTGALVVAAPPGLEGGRQPGGGGGGGGMAVVWLPREWAWHALLLVTGVASLSGGADGEFTDVDHC